MAKNPVRVLVTGAAGTVILLRKLCFQYSFSLFGLYENGGQYKNFKMGCISCCRYVIIKIGILIHDPENDIPFQSTTIVK